MRKHFLGLFVIGFVDSEGNLVKENVLRDAHRTASLTAKIMRENMGNAYEMQSCLNRILYAWLIDSDTDFSGSVANIIGKEAACIAKHLWLVAEALEDDEFSDYQTEYLMTLIVEVANTTRDQIIDNFMKFMTGGTEDESGGM